MQQQTKDDLKAAWQSALPVFKSVAIKAAMAVGGMFWLVLLVGLLCTMFWVGVIQLVLTIMGAIVYAKYSSIVYDREWEAKHKVDRRGY